MKRKFTDDDASKFASTMQMLEIMWGVRTIYSVDSETGRGSISIWLPGTETALHLETIDVRHVMIVERNRQCFPDRGNP